MTAWHIPTNIYIIFHQVLENFAHVSLRFVPVVGKYVLGRKKKGCNTRTSQGVTHPSTTLAQARLTAEFWWDPVR